MEVFAGELKGFLETVWVEIVDFFERLLLFKGLLVVGILGAFIFLGNFEGLVVFWDLIIFWDLLGIFLSFFKRFDVIGLLEKLVIFLVIFEIFVTF